MSKQITPGAPGSPTEPSGAHFQPVFNDHSTDRAALAPEQAESIRSIAETIVKQLCARHIPPNDSSTY